MAKQSSRTAVSAGYKDLLGSVSALLENGRRSAAKSVNAVLTATYWLLGQRIVQYEQGGHERAAYGSEVLKRLSEDLSGRFGRGCRTKVREDTMKRRLYEEVDRFDNWIVRSQPFRSIALA